MSPAAAGRCAIRRRASAAATLAALLCVAPSGCWGEPSGPDTEAVILQGTMTDSDGLPVAGVFVHLVHGLPVAPVPVDVDETDEAGAYLVGGEVPVEACGAVQLWVLRDEVFDAFADRGAAVGLGSCDARTVDLTVSFEEGGG